MLVHLNSRILNLSDARISPLDRGFLFGDALYEGLRAFSGRIVAPDLHAHRLAQGLAEIHLDWDACRLTDLSLELLRANNLRDAFIYWQVSRGAPAPGQPVRTRLLTAPTTPTVFGYCFPTPTLDDCRATIPTKSAITLPDDRWARCHVKTTSLLGAILASLNAQHARADDAIFIKDGLVSESTSANLFAAIPTPAGAPGGGSDLSKSGLSGNQGAADQGNVEIVTPALDSTPMLAGVTRDLILSAAARAGVPISQRPLRADELARASEVMLCGTLTMVTAITRLDGRILNDGRLGPVARRLHDLLIDAIAEGA